MNLPINWLKDYVDINCSINEFCDALTLSGSKVEGYENKGAIIKNTVVGKVLEIEKHPDADKLVVTKIDIGETEPIQIVTGATNLFIGAYIPVALNGAVLANNLKIKKGKLRGVESNGMLCSIEELGFTKNDYPEASENGIYIFEKEQALGANVVDILEMNDDVVEFEITSNRSDCFSIIGLAREVASTFRKDLKLPQIIIKEIGQGKASEYISVDIQNSELCSRYTARVVKNVKIKPSPQWLRHRLTASGIRPINNIVDITNYVMLEYGQPMHAFNINTISGNKIVIKNSNDNEKFTTLDGIERTLDSSMLVISDKDKTLAIAGVIGGENSMITSDAETVLFEAASFNGSNIRLTAKKLGIRTDSSSKFEKGIDVNLTEIAINRAMQLVEELECGEVVKGTVDSFPNKSQQIVVDYEPQNINKLLGTKLSNEEIVSLLKLAYIDTDEKIAKIPSFRKDLETEADLAEEVGRFYGYDKIDATLYTGTPTVGKKTNKQIIEEVITNTMISCGLNEILTYSFESPKVFDKLNISNDSELRKTVVISNPLGEDFSIMRTTTLNGMLNCISNNYNKRNESAKLFEIGKVYIPKELPLKELPVEKNILTLGMYGELDFYYIKGILKQLFSTLNIQNVEFNTFKDLTYMHPGRTAKVSHNNEYLGYVGQLYPSVADNYDIEVPVYIAVLDLDYLFTTTSFERSYKPLPKFPAMQRDIAMVIKSDINVIEIEKIIVKKGGKNLESIKLFDVYQGEQIKDGYKSIAYRIYFRSSEKTLNEEEVNSFIKDILKELEYKLNAELRDK